MDNEAMSEISADYAPPLSEYSEVPGTTINISQPKPRSLSRTKRLKKFFFGCCGYNPDGDRQASKHDPYPVIHVYNNYEMREVDPPLTGQISEERNIHSDRDGYNASIMPMDVNNYRNKIDQKKLPSPETGYGKAHNENNIKYYQGIMCHESGSTSSFSEIESIPVEESLCKLAPEPFEHRSEAGNDVQGLPPTNDTGSATQDDAVSVEETLMKPALDPNEHSLEAGDDVQGLPPTDDFVSATQNKPMSGAVAPVKPVPEPCDIHGLPPGVEVNHAKQVNSANSQHSSPRANVRREDENKLPDGAVGGESFDTGYGSGVDRYNSYIADDHTEAQADQVSKKNPVYTQNQGSQNGQISESGAIPKSTARISKSKADSNHRVTDNLLNQQCQKVTTDRELLRQHRTAGNDDTRQPQILQNDQILNGLAEDERSDVDTDGANALQYAIRASDSNPVAPAQHPTSHLFPAAALNVDVTNNSGRSTASSTPLGAISAQDDQFIWPEGDLIQEGVHPESDISSNRSSTVSSDFTSVSRNGRRRTRGTRYDRRIDEVLHLNRQISQQNSLILQQNDRILQHSLSAQ